MMTALINRDAGDETDHQCEMHPEAVLLLYEDGNAESGPGRPYYDCPECRDEVDHPMIHCYFCNKEARTERMSLTNVPFDPTTAYHLECGHVII